MESGQVAEDVWLPGGSNSGGRDNASYSLYDAYDETPWM